MQGFYYVYRLRSVSHPAEVYTGVTENLDERVRKHNSGSVPHTAKYRPWFLDMAIAFRSRDKAAAFESYLKSGSGREFARRHF